MSGKPAAFVARRATAACIVVITAFFAAVLSCGVSQVAYAFELNPNDSSAEANHGIQYYFVDDELVLVIPATNVYEGYCSGDDSCDELVIPAQIMDDGVSKTVTSVRCPSATEKGVAKRNPLNGLYKGTNRTITKAVLPRTIETLETDRLFMDAKVESIEFAEGEEPLALKVLGNKSMGSARKLNAGVVDGEYYDCVIPYGVERIEDQAFAYSTMTSLWIPSTVTYADNNALGAGGTSALAKVCSWMPDYPTFVEKSNVLSKENILIMNAGGLTSIGGQSGEDFETYVIPDTVKRIDDWAFADCKNLKRIVIPASVTSIGERAFAGCSSLEEVVFEEGSSLESIGERAFYHCSLIAELDLPDSVSWIGPSAFAGTSITFLDVPASVFVNTEANRLYEGDELGDVTTHLNTPWFIESNYIDIYKLDDPQYRNTSLVSVDMSDAKQSYLAPYLFADCVSLKEVSISRNIDSIKGAAFFNCVSLKDVYFYGDVYNLSITDTYSYEGSFGTAYVPGAFAYNSDGFNSDNKQTEEALAEWVNMPGLTFYGSAMFDEGNKLLAFCQENGYEYVPFVALDGSSADVIAKFGGAIPSNAVTASNPQMGAEPVFSVSFADDETRTLAAGEGCSVTYRDASGNAVSDITKAPAGTYVATITGDGKSVFGSAEVSFTVVDPNPPAEKYSITYVLGAGGVNAATNPSTYVSGAEVTLSAPTRLGYTFAGWYLDAAFTKPVTSIAAGTTGDVTLYAKWQPQGVPTTPEFTDVDKGAYYADAVEFMVNHDLIYGYGGTTLFGVGDTMTRAQLATILWRYAQPGAADVYVAGATANTTGMTDVEGYAWYTGAANWAVSKGVINGMENADGTRSFNPDGQVTFEQLVTILANLIDAEGAAASDVSALNSFTDGSSVSDWAAHSMAWAVDAGLVSGYDNGDATRTLAPGENVTRERAATVIYNAFLKGMMK